MHEVLKATVFTDDSHHQKDGVMIRIGIPHMPVTWNFARTADADPLQVDSDRIDSQLTTMQSAVASWRF